MCALRLRKTTVQQTYHCLVWPKKVHFDLHLLLDASKHLYMRVCPYVRMSVCYQFRLRTSDASYCPPGLVVCYNVYNPNRWQTQTNMHLLYTIQRQCQASMTNQSRIMLTETKCRLSNFSYWSLHVFFSKLTLFFSSAWGCLS